VRFTEFLRTTVLLSAASASLLAAVVVAGVATGGGDNLLVPISAGWWILAGLSGLWLGRRAETSPPIASVLARARTGRTLPELNPASVVLNRLWPLLIGGLGAAAVGVALPQVAAIAAGFTIVWALAWRRQAAAVTAIEDRDGVRFYIERTSPFQPLQLLRTPGFRATSVEHNGSEPSAAGGAGGRA
jgi:hypothetical protein